MGIVVFTLASAVLAEAMTIILVHYWIRLLKGGLGHNGGHEEADAACRHERRRYCAMCLHGVDANKTMSRACGGVLVPEAGGLWAVFSAVIGLLAFEAFYAFTHDDFFEALPLAAISMTLLISGLIGFVDDVANTPPLVRVVLSAAAAAPLIPFKLGVSKVDLPFVGTVDLGLAYPLLAVPIGVIGAANAFNMLAGINGLEAGNAALLLAFTAVYAYLEGIAFVAAASLILLAATAGFLVFNWYPAKAFPGNAFTYGIGAAYAGLVIVGDFQKFGLAIFLLYFVELALYVRSKLDGVRKENFGVLRSDGSLDPPGPRVYSLTHIAMKALRRLGVKPTEARVTLFILGLQTLIGLAALLIFT